MLMCSGLHRLKFKPWFNGAVVVEGTIIGVSAKKTMEGKLQHLADHEGRLAVGRRPRAYRA